MNYRIEHGGPELLDSVESLWQELNVLHREKSIHFKEDYKAFRFETRMWDLIEKSKKGSLRVTLGFDHHNRIIGYCISTIEGREGEVDSIFVIEDYRRRGIGAALIEDSMDWFHENSIDRIKVAVVYGNEEAFAFYEKYGLFPRVTILTTGNWFSGIKE